VRTVVGVVSGSTWTASPVAPHLPDGIYTAQASQSDEAGNVGRSPAVTFTVDTTSPVVSIASVSSPTNDSTPTLTGGAGTAVGDDSTVAVAVYEGASVSGSPVRTVVGVVSGSTWTASPVAPHLPDGIYTAQASQSDEAGNTGESGAVTFTVDTTPPAVAVTAPSIGAVLNYSRPTISGLAGQASGDEQSVTLKLYAGPTASGSPVQKLETTPGGGAWTTAGAVSALANGIYTVLAEQSDAAGNTGTSTATFTITTSTPVVTLEASGLVARGPLHLTGPTPSFTGSASTAPEDGKSVIVNLYSGTSASGSPVQTMAGAVAGSTWNVGPLAALADGTYTARAEQKDSDFYGQAGVSAPVTFTVDADPPVVTLTSPVSGSMTSEESESVGGTADTAAGDLPAITVKLFAGSTITSQAPLEAVTVQAVNEHWTAAFGGLSSGTYTARAQQSDDVGNVGFSKPVTFTVNAPKVIVPAAGSPTPPATPPSPPVASFQWFPSAPHVAEPVSLVSTSTDATGQITGFAWSFAGNGVFTGGTDTLTTSFSTPGAHVVLLRVTDASGQSSVATERIPVTSPVPTLMQPFPVVRIAGSENASGVRVGLLSVQAPVGAMVTVTCRGPGCRTRSQGVVAAVGKSKSTTGMAVIVFGRFERSLRAGAVLEIRVSKPGQIGKYTRFTVRRGKLPVRVDTCLSPAGVKPIVCPSS
jgi:Bacterial Ig-like domain/PKD domain